MLGATCKPADIDISRLIGLLILEKRFLLPLFNVPLTSSMT